MKLSVVKEAAISATMALCTGGDVVEAITNSAVDAILIGGIIAFVNDGVSAAKTAVRSVRNAKLIGGIQMGPNRRVL